MSVKTKQKVFFLIVFHYFIINESFNCCSYIFFINAMFVSGGVELNGNVHVSSIIFIIIGVNRFFFLLSNRYSKNKVCGCTLANL